MAEYEKQSWVDGDASKPLSASRLNKLETQFDRARETVAADIADAETPIGSALSTTIDASVTPAVDAALAELSALPDPDWTPAEVPGLLAWFDAQSLVLADGATVDSWPDKSGGAHHALAGGTGTEPIFQAAGADGFPGVKFDGSNDYLATEAFTTYTGAWTIYCVAISLPLTTTGDDTFFAGKPASSTTARLAFDRRNTDALRADQGSSSTLQTADGAAGNGMHLFRLTVNGVSSSIYMDGTELLAGTLALSSRDVNQLFLGSRSNGTNFLDGLLCELVFVQGAVSAGDDADMIDYLNNRWWLS